MKKEFEIDLNIYSKDLVFQAIEDFSDVWKIELDDDMIIISWDDDWEIEEIFNEYMNYLLSL